MPLFERGYKAAATAELERSVRELEERNKIAQTKADFMKDAASTESNLNFAERINLISTTQAEAYRERKIQTSLADFKRLERLETRDIVNDFENPREIARRYYDMDSYNTQIAKERELDHLKSVNSSVHSNDNKER